jgi:hypothetical protein
VSLMRLCRVYERGCSYLTIWEFSRRCILTSDILALGNV